MISPLEENPQPNLWTILFLAGLVSIIVQQFPLSVGSVFHDPKLKYYCQKL